MVEITGGEKLQTALTDIARQLGRAGSVRIGFLENARYPDGTLVAMVAAIQEYGAPRAGIPPRPFFRNTVAAKYQEWPSAIANLLKVHNYDTKKVLALTGEAIKGQIQQGIRDTNTPPLKPATIRRKGFSKPLIDTGVLINSVAYEVTD